VPSHADIGLGGRFGDVILEGAVPGRTYDLREASHVPFAVENKGDADTDVIIEFEKPTKEATAKDYEPVPDPSWFKALPDRMTIARKSVGYFDLLLSIPDDPALKGKSYQVTIKARMATNAMLAVAVSGRLRFSMGPGPQSIAEEKRQKAMQRLDFDITPRSLYLIEVPTGKEWDSRKEATKSVRLANYAPDKLNANLIVGAWESSVPIPNGYEKIPDPSWLVVKKAHLSVATDEIAAASVVVNVPDKPENRGKKWVAMIRTQLDTGFWLDVPVKLFLETKP
jgi:hypothetical protein